MLRRVSQLYTRGYDVKTRLKQFAWLKTYSPVCNPDTDYNDV